jgi:Flp pilus assembly protein TadG
MMRSLLRLAAARSGSAPAELALSMPIMIALMFGAFELGHFFLSEHVVQKAVRDAARYASRLPLESYPSCSPTADAIEDIQQVARTGDPDGTVQRLHGWSANTMTTVAVTCDTSGTYTGIYDGVAMGVPTVTVSASVPYPSLFGAMGIPMINLELNARSQSAVFGA